jgi:hypothetical protein
MWINDDVNMDGLLGITATLNSGTYSLQWYVYGGGATLATFGSQGAAQSALDSLLATAGYPWIAIGSLSSVANSQDPRVIAVNLANVVQMAAVTDVEGSGLSFNVGWRSAGYSPYANSADAIAAILALTGSISFP